MTIIVHTRKPEYLFKVINYRINNNILNTWEIIKDDINNIYYNHTPKQWTNKMLLKPVKHQNGLQLTVHWFENNVEPDRSTKGYILGRFTEVLMVHFRKYFTKIELN